MSQDYKMDGFSIILSHLLPQNFFILDHITTTTVFFHSILLYTELWQGKVGGKRCRALARAQILGCLFCPSIFHFAEFFSNLRILWRLLCYKSGSVVSRFLVFGFWQEPVTSSYHLYLARAQYIKIWSEIT